MRLGQSRILAMALACLATGCVKRVQESHVFMPRPLPSLDVTQSALPCRHLEIPYNGEEALRGWHIIHPNPRATLVFFYGTGEKVSRAHWRLFPWAERFRLSIICVDYRGFGYSDGQPSLATLREDALRIFDTTASLRKGMPTLVMGYSMGSVAAVHVAANRPVDGLALMAPISSTEEVFPALSHRVPWYLRPFLRLEPDPELLRYTPPVEEVRRVQAPLIVLHGEADPVVPVTAGRHVLEAAGSISKRWCSVPGAAHNDVYLWHDPARSAFQDWLDDALAAPVTVHQESPCPASPSSLNPPSRPSPSAG